MQVLEMVLEQMDSAAASDLPSVLTYLFRSMTSITKGQVCRLTLFPHLSFGLPIRASML